MCEEGSAPVIVCPGPIPTTCATHPICFSQTTLPAPLSATLQETPSMVCASHGHRTTTHLAVVHQAVPVVPLHLNKHSKGPQGVDLPLVDAEGGRGLVGDRAPSRGRAPGWGSWQRGQRVV